MTRQTSLATLLATSLLLGSASNALAAGAAPLEPTGPVDVELPRLLAPMVVDGRLQGYAFMTISLVPASPGQVLVIREKMHFLQDAFVRELNRGPILMADDPHSVDTDTVKLRLMARVREVLPANSVEDLKFDQVVFAPLMPE
jgi:hypothetical protein